MKTKASSKMVIEDFKPEWIRRRSIVDDATKARIPQIYCERCSGSAVVLLTEVDRAFITKHSVC